jgi:hypothetical protein
LENTVQMNPYYTDRPDEGRKQLYWGAFVLGCATFHKHRNAGYCFVGRALQALASKRFTALQSSSRELPRVEAESQGAEVFTDAFVAGYRQRAHRCGLRGLELRRTLPI